VLLRCGVVVHGLLTASAAWLVYDLAEEALSAYAEVSRLCAAAVWCGVVGHGLLAAGVV
jgi:hypothetical protein